MANPNNVEFIENKKYPKFGVGVYAVLWGVAAT
ncbi:hypothetical protein CCACVL1_16516 [Corchorus capsularis]|uniref:Uncharacterized protein n=1 Tax=Corchorus capsularis TaxID=210143 RepID=A0A1R3HWH8_COCAP|nr:hypothetical protein CCACVL1_16516 [Corchorus capsularis]